jgi:hypothetical protein
MLSVDRPPIVVDSAVMQTMTASFRAETIDYRTRQLSRTFIRSVSAGYTHGARTPAEMIRAAALRFPGDPEIQRLQDAYRGFVAKTAVPPGTVVGDPDSAALTAFRPYSEAFLAIVRPQTILDRLSVRPVPFWTSVSIETASSVAGWIGEGNVKAVGTDAFAAVTLQIAKIYTIIVVTKELASLGAPGSEDLLLRDLAAGVAQFTDQQFVDPAVAPVTGGHPGSITNGIAAIPPSGTTAAAAVKDLATLAGAILATVPDPTNVAILMTPTVAAMVIAQTNSLTLTVRGGTYLGFDVVTSASVGNRIIAVDASQILVADAGIVVEATEEATIQMNSAPDDPVTAITAPTSLWQNNLVGLRAERFCHWKRARNSAVAYISPTAYVPGT